MFQEVLQGDGVTTRRSVSYTDQLGVYYQPRETNQADSGSLELQQLEEGLQRKYESHTDSEKPLKTNTTEVSSSNILQGALEAMRVATRQSIRRPTLPVSICPTFERDIEYSECRRTIQPCDPEDSYLSVMMTGITTIEEQMASLTKMVEEMSKHMQRQEESLSHIAEKVLDHDHRT
ncbi:hypothetical protein LIER_23777 [Lithospermum erythrorhizon]|uniref:Uncharacterized protein n=1 Tax=Lithospermum erythrorhizon TaxID=34254 RepID=A0AAV3R207_LITER